MWARMRTLGWILYFMIWCMSHLGSNEVRAVMEVAGSCRRTSLLKKKGTTNDERVLLVELLTDLHHATCTTDGCGALLHAQTCMDSALLCMQCVCRVHACACHLRVVA